jgi:hypothetical protein
MPCKPHKMAEKSMDLKKIKKTLAFWFGFCYDYRRDNLFNNTEEVLNYG